jgi:hypothetical protein
MAAGRGEWRQASLAEVEKRFHRRQAFVFGQGFQIGAKILLNGERQRRSSMISAPRPT